MRAKQLLRVDDMYSCDDHHRSETHSDLACNCCLPGYTGSTVPCQLQLATACLGNVGACAGLQTRKPLKLV